MRASAREMEDQGGFDSRFLGIVFLCVARITRFAPEVKETKNQGVCWQEVCDDAVEFAIVF
jgi:hypothetical protein